MFINHSSKEVTAKIVYYGPGLSGKTTNLQYIFSITNPKTRGELISIETRIERTLFFDLLPINVGLINGYQAKFQLYTVPGQIFYNSTRKLVLKGADGIVFVADSQELMKMANFESLENLKTNLADYNQAIHQIPLVFQFNKRDLANILPEEELNRTLNTFNYPYFPAIATEGKGVIETLRKISGLILKKLKLLLEQDAEEPRKIPAVQFDTNKKQKIIEKVDLPYKVIPRDNFESADFKIGPNKENEAQKDDDGEEELKVETLEPVQPFEFKDIENAFKYEKPGKKKAGIPEDAGETKPAIEIKPGEETKKKPEAAKIIHKNEGAAIPKKNRPKSAGLDLLEQLDDKTRVTIIKALPIRDPQLFIDIKDKNSNLLESLKIDIAPGTKKVTLILDVKN